MRWESKEHIDYYGWRSWFAWKPVRLGDWLADNKQIIWLERIERKFESSFEANNSYSYRLPRKENDDIFRERN